MTPDYSGPSVSCDARPFSELQADPSIEFRVKTVKEAIIEHKSGGALDAVTVALMWYEDEPNVVSIIFDDRIRSRVEHADHASAMADAEVLLNYMITGWKISLEA